MASAGIEPVEIPDKIAYPLVLSAALEDDPTLQEKWAALLANAADPLKSDWVRLLYVEILKQLSPLEVKLLDELFDTVLLAFKDRCRMGLAESDLAPSPDIASTIVIGGGDALTFAYVKSGLSKHRIEELLSYQSLGAYAKVGDEMSALLTARDTLLRQRLLEIKKTVKLKPGSGRIDTKRRDPQVNIEFQETEESFMTALGFAFVRACRPPTPVAK